MDSGYEPGRRSPAWLKVKPAQSAEFVIGGYTRGKGARGKLGALLLGYWDGRELQLRRRTSAPVSTMRSLAQLQGAPQALTATRSRSRRSPPLNRPTTWVSPSWWPR